MASEEKWGVWCFADGGGWVYGSGGPDGRTDNVFDERTAAEKLRGLIEWQDAGTNYEVRPYPAAQPCAECCRAVCNCDDQTWGYWVKEPDRTSPSFCCIGTRTLAAEVYQGRAVGYPKNRRGPVQRRSDPPWRFEENAEAANWISTDAVIHQPVTFESIQQAARDLGITYGSHRPLYDPIPPSFLPPSIDISLLARAIHATDQRVIALVQRRGDKIDSAAVWKAGERGSAEEATWNAEAISRACAVAALMGGSK